MLGINIKSLMRNVVVVRPKMGTITFPFLDFVIQANL